MAMPASLEKLPRTPSPVMYMVPGWVSVSEWLIVPLLFSVMVTV